MFNSAVQKGINDSQQFGYVTSFLRTAEKYSNIERNVINLDKNGISKTLNERVLPFVYDLDDYSLSVTQEIPLKQSDFESFYDTINMYKLFEADGNFMRAYSGLDVSIDTMQNPLWGGVSDELVFLLEPQCFQLRESDTNLMYVEGSSHEKCDELFDVLEIVRYDVNITIKNFADDYNMVKCDNKENECTKNKWQSEFTTDEDYPFFEVQIIDEDCKDCEIDAAYKKISQYSAPGTAKIIEISCDGPNCHSDPITITFENGVKVEHKSDERVIVEIKTEFNTEIQSFYYPDFDVNVAETDFNVFVTNKADFD